MDKVTVVKPETKVEIQQTISQQDVIELVAHKQIKKLEAEKTEVNNDLDKIKEKLKEVSTKYNDNVLKEVTKVLTPFINLLDTPHQINLLLDTDTSFGPKNEVRVELRNKNSSVKIFHLDRTKLSTTKSKTHVELEEKRIDLIKSIESLNNDIQKIKTDKNSIKNAITEQLLMETKEGKSLLSLVENAYKDSFPKLLK